MSIFSSFPSFRQLESRDCGPACLQIIAKHHGKYFSLDDLRDKCGVTKEGLSVYDLCETAESMGLKALPVKTTYNKLKDEIPLPCIAHWRNSHYLVIYKVTKNHVYISDPAIGLIKRTRSEFLYNWLENKKDNQSLRKGIIIALEPTEKFYELKATRQAVAFTHILTYLLGYLKPYKRQSLQLVLLMVIISLIQMVFPFITSSIVDIGISAKDMGFVKLLLLANIVLVISTAAGNWVRQSINLHIASRIKISLLSNYMSKLMALPISYFESRLLGDSIQRVNDYDRLQSFVMNSFFTIVLAVLNIGIFSFILSLYDATLLLIFWAGSALYIGWTLLFWNIRKKMDIKVFDLEAKNNSYWIELLTNISEIKNNNYEKGKRWRWEKLQVKLYENGLKLLNVNQINEVGAELLNTLKDVTLTFYAGYLVIDNQITLGIMVSIQFILGQLRTPLSELIRFITSYQSAYISFVRMNEVNLIPDEQTQDIMDNAVFPGERTLKLRGIFFRYERNGPLILNNVSVDIPAGKVTAIVGESGSGKTTLLKILMRLYTPVSGEYFIGDTNINNVSLKTWRDKIGVVNQDGDVFRDTIRNNIILGNKYDHEQFMYAVTASNILKDIEKLPLGFNTVMGENGRGLSQGQKQRVMIARALYKAPEYLFFDEATNALDTINEFTVISNLNKELQNRTSVIVAHRLATIRNADQIIVFKDGRIAEIGTHASLLVAKGLYYDLFHKQLEHN